MKAFIFLNGEYDYKDNFLKKIIDKDSCSRVPATRCAASPAR